MSRFSYSQALLAVAMAYLAFSLLKIAEQLPDIVAVINKTTVSVDNISPQIPVIVAEVAQIRSMLDKQIPDILQQVTLTRPVISDVVNESHQYSQQLPELLIHLQEIEKQVAQLQQALPHILQRVDDVVKTTQNTTDEIALWRPHSTQYLTQIEQSRTDIPKYLTRAEHLVVDAKTIGSEASSGLFVGLIKGAVRLPFDVFDGLSNIVDAESRSAKNFTAKDIAILQENALTLLDNSESYKAVWQNTESGSRGVINKGKRFNKQGQDCHKLTFVNYFKRDKETLTEIMCLDNKDIWQVMPNDF